MEKEARPNCSTLFRAGARSTAPDATVVMHKAIRRRGLLLMLKKWHIAFGSCTVGVKSFLGFLGGDLLVCLYV